MKTIAITAVLIISMQMMTGCDGPTTQSVTADFLLDHPEATVTSALPGEGDFGNVYYHIRFRTSQGSNEEEEVWLYQRDRHTNKWRATKKALPVNKK